MWINKPVLFILLTQILKLRANDSQDESGKHSLKFVCPSAGVFPDPSDDCKHYHHCRQVNETPIATQTCSSNEIFDTFEKQCVPEKDANCINCEKDGILKDMRDARFYITCKGGMAERHPCEPEDSVFNEDELVCEPEDNARHKKDKYPMIHHPAFNSFSFNFHAEFLRAFQESKKRIWGSRHSHLNAPSIKVDTVAQAGEAKASAAAISRGETSAGLAHSQASLGVHEKKIKGTEIFKGLGFMNGEFSNVHAMATATGTGGKRRPPVEVKSSESEERHDGTTKRPEFYLKEDTIQLGKHADAGTSRNRKHEGVNKHKRRRRQGLSPWIQNQDLGQMIRENTNRIIAQGFAGASPSAASFNEHHQWQSNQNQGQSSQNQWQSSQNQRKSSQTQGQSSQTQGQSSQTQGQSSQNQRQSSQNQEQSLGVVSHASTNVAYQGQQQPSLTDKAPSVQNSDHAAQNLVRIADQPMHSNPPAQVESRSLQRSSSVVHNTNQQTNDLREDRHMQKTDHDEEQHILILHHQNQENHHSNEHSKSDEHSESDEHSRERERQKSSKMHKGGKTFKGEPDDQQSEEDRDEHDTDESDEHHSDSQEYEDHESEEYHRDDAKKVATKNDKDSKIGKSKSSAKKNSERNHRDSSEEHQEIVVEWERKQAPKKHDHKHHHDLHTNRTQKNSFHTKAVTVPKQGRNAHHERQTTHHRSVKPTEKSTPFSPPATNNHSQVRKETEGGNASVTERTEVPPTTTQSPQTDRIADKRKAGTKSGRGIIPGAAKHSTIRYPETTEEQSTIRHPETTEKRSTLRHPATTESTGLTKGQTTARPTKVNSKFGGLEDGQSTLKPVILSSTPIRVTPLEPRKKLWQSVPTIVPLPASGFQNDTDSVHHSSSTAQPTTQGAIIVTEKTPNTSHAEQTTKHSLTVTPAGHHEAQDTAGTVEGKTTKGPNEKESKRRRKPKTGRRVKFTGGDTGSNLKNRKFSGRKKGVHMGRGVLGLPRTSTIAPQQGPQLQSEPQQSTKKCKNCRKKASTKGKSTGKRRVKGTTNRNLLASDEHHTRKSGDGSHRGGKNATADKKNGRLAKGETQNDIVSTLAPAKPTVKKITTRLTPSTIDAPDSTKHAQESTTHAPDSTTQVPDSPKTTRKRKRKTIKKKIKVHKKKCVRKNKKNKNNNGSRSLNEHVDWMPEVTEEPVTEWIDVTEWETVTEIVDYVDESKTKKPKKQKKFRLRLNEGPRWAESKAIAGSTSDAISVSGGSAKDTNPNSRVMADAMALVWSVKGKAAADPSSDQRDHRKKLECPNPPCKSNFAQAESQVSSRSSSSRRGHKVNAGSNGKRTKRYVQLNLKPHSNKNGTVAVPALNFLLVGTSTQEDPPSPQLAFNSLTPPQSPDPRISKRAVDTEEVEEIPRSEKRLRKKCKKKPRTTHLPKETTKKPRTKKPKTKKPKNKLNSEEAHSPLVEQVQKGLETESENEWTLSNKIDPFDFVIEPAGFHGTDLLSISRTFGNDNVGDPDWTTGQEHPDSSHAKIPVSYEKTFGATNTSSFKTAFITDQGDGNGTITSGTSEIQDLENYYSTEKKKGSEKKTSREKSRKEEKFAASQTAKDGIKQMSADAKVEHHENASVTEFDQHTGDKKVEVHDKKLLKVNTTKSHQGIDGIIKTTSNGSTNGSETLQSTYIGSDIIIQENLNKKLLSQSQLTAQKEGSKEKKLLTSKLVFSNTKAKHANDSGVVQLLSNGNSVTSDLQVSNITDGKDGQSMIMNSTYVTETQSHKNKTGEHETAISHQKSQGSEANIAVTAFNGTAKITDFSTLIGGDTTSKINKTKDSEVISNLHSQITKHTDRDGAVESLNGNRRHSKFTVQREDDAKQTLTVVERTNDDKGRPKTEKITESNRTNVLNMKEVIKNLANLNTNKSKVDTVTTGNRSVVSSGSEILTLLSPEGKRLETVARVPSPHRRVQILDSKTSKDDHADNNSEETNCKNCECTKCECKNCQISSGEDENKKNDNSQRPSHNSSAFPEGTTHQFHIPESPETNNMGSDHTSQPHGGENKRNDTELLHYSDDKGPTKGALFDKDEAAAAHAAAGRQDGPAVAIVASHSKDELSETGSVAAAGNAVARAAAKAQLKSTEERNHRAGKNDGDDWAKIEIPHSLVTR